MKTTGVIGTCVRRGFAATMLASTAMSPLFSSAPALAGCAPAAPMSGETVTCSGSTVGQNPANGFGNSSMTGITVNVESGASVEALPTGHGIQLGDGIINNSGTLTGRNVGSGARLSTGTVNNAEGATITGFDGVASLDGVTINNEGFITGTFAGIVGSGVNPTINNAATGEIKGANFGIDSIGGNVTNHGLISGNVGIELTFGGANIFNAGTITGAGGAAIRFRSGVVTLAPTSQINGNVVSTTNNGALHLGGTGSGTFNASEIGASAKYRGFDTFVKTDTSTWTLTGSTSQVTPWALLSGVLDVSADGSLGAASGSLTFDGGTLQFGAAFDLAATRAITLNLGGGTIDTNGFDTTIAQAIGGAGGLTKAGPGTLVLTGTSTYTGSTHVDSGTLRVSGQLANTSSVNVHTAGTVQADNASALGSAIVVLNGGTLRTNFTGTFANSIQFTTIGLSALAATTGTEVTLTGPIALDNNAIAQFGSATDAGTVIIGPGVNASGAAEARVAGGTLIVNGTLGAFMGTTVNSGATLGGSGIVTDALTIDSGGTLSPGQGTGISTLAVQGSLVMSTAATYLVDVSGSADRTSVQGTASLGGTVQARFAPGASPGSYTILSATGGFGGTEFAGLSTSALTNFAASLSYTPTDVLLNIIAALGLGANLNQNQQNVANTLNTFFNNGNALPPGFVTVFGLTGQPLANALTQLSGEHATGIQRATNLSTGLFLNAMLDPFVMGRSGGFGAGTAMGYAQETQVAAREAYAADMPLKAAPPAAIYEQRWSVWGAGYGGRSRVDGEPVIGSNDLTANAAGFAAGADYRVSPSSVIGAAFAIGETRWNVAGVGKGNADVAQVGGYASTRWNDLYVSGAVALAWHDASTDRTLNVAGTDRLRADFNATSWGARLEGGYRYGGPAFGLTPYAAVQMQSVRTPDYSERATAGSNQFALSYVSESVIDTRTELGFWADARHALGNGSQLILRGRAAWVHDFNPDSRIQAAFQTLPGTSFVVDGAAAPRDAALTSAVAELRMANGVSLIGKFDGEFSGRSNTYAGTGTLRYSW